MTNVLLHFGMVLSLNIPSNAEFPNIWAWWMLPGHFIRTFMKWWLHPTVPWQFNVKLPFLLTISSIINWHFDFYMCTVNSTDALRESISFLKVLGMFFNFICFRKCCVLWPKFYWNHRGNTPNDFWNSCLS